MFYLRLLENWFAASETATKSIDHILIGYGIRNDYDLIIKPNTGPGFLNAWNRYNDPY